MLKLHQPKKINKSWGYELIFTNDSDSYTGKLLHFQRNTMGSLHYHVEKNETWYVASGAFNVDLSDPTNGKKYTILLLPGDCLTLPKGNAHRIFCFTEGDIFESSTPDNPNDSYRIRPEDFALEEDSGSSGSWGHLDQVVLAGGFGKES